MMIKDFLEPLTSPVRRKPFAVYDIESKDAETDHAGFTRPFLAGFFDGERFQSFRNDEFLKAYPYKRRHIHPGGCLDKMLRAILVPEYAGRNIYAHNGGNFDHLFLLAWLRAQRSEFGFEVIPVQSSIQSIKVWSIPEDPDDKTLTWTFLDSIKLLPMSLEKAAKAFQLPGKEDLPLETPEKDPRWESYNEQDCRALYAVIEKAHDLVEHKLGGEVAVTTPATSMKLYRRRFLGRDGTPKKIPRHAHFRGCADKLCSGCCHLFIRDAYYGGRTEIHRFEGSGLRYYDINSSYVAAMLEDMPAGERRVEEGHLTWDLCRQYIGFSRCTVHVPEDCPYPPLPYRADSGKLIFPVGTFSGTWDVDELAMLLELGGRLVDVERTVWFRRKPLFAPMMRELWSLRDKKRADYDEGLSALGKLLGNSLYGKFGMDPERTSIIFAQLERENTCFLCGAPEVIGNLCERCVGSRPADGTVECDVWYQKKEVQAPYIIPQIAAHITTLARLRLLRFMYQAHSLGGRIWYCDTDSILTDVVMPSSSELGALKDEFPGELLRGRFIQPKVYLLEKDKPFDGEHLKTCRSKTCKGCSTTKVAMKGFPKAVRTVDTLDRLERGDVISFERLEKIRTLASARFERPPAMAGVKKSFRSQYDKRLRDTEGGTLPVNFSDTDQAAEE